MNVSGDFKRYPLLMAAATFLLIGCAAPRVAVRPPEAAAPKIETVEQARQSLLKNYGDVRSVRASGKVEMKLSDEKHWRPASFVLMLERPDKVRVRAYRPLAPTFFELISNGQKCWLFIPSERTAYLDENCGTVRAGAENIAISAEAVTAAVLVVPDFDKLFSSPAHYHAQDDSIGLLTVEEPEMRREIWINSATGLVTRQVIEKSDGTVEADITYGGNDVIGDAIVPDNVEVDFPTVKASIRLYLYMNKVKINSEIPPDAFTFSPPENTAILIPKRQDLDSFFR